MSELQNKIRLALNEESQSTFGMSTYSFQTEEQLEEAKRAKKEEKSEESSTSESSESCSSKKKELELTEQEVIDIKLSASQVRSLAVASIAESMVNESINEDETLSSLGLLVEGKLTAKGKDLLNKYIPTLLAS